MILCPVCVVYALVNLAFHRLENNLFRYTGGNDPAGLTGATGE
jgi:hypothetical protein